MLLLVLSTSAAVAAPAAGDTDADPLIRLVAERTLAEPGVMAVTPSEGGTGTVEPAPLARADGTFVRQVRDRASEMVLTAMNFLGVPYRRGGTGEDGSFDCSGFTRHIVASTLGLVLPRRAAEQAGAPELVAVRANELRPGDLVFFNTLRRTFSHVGIYIGGGRFIHAPRPGGEVRVDSMHLAYWTQRFTGARRAAPVVVVASAGEAPPITEQAPSPLASDH